jgi:hypothetical protein
MEADCAASPEAERLYWQNLEAAKGLLNELDHQPECRRQALAAHVLNINMDFQASSTDEEGSGSHFPLLQHLTVEHRHGLDCEQTRLYARMEHLVGPMLRKLNVAYIKHFISNIQPSVDNFLPTLATSTKLRVLQVSAHVDVATSGDLTAALEKCQKLEVVHLGKYTGFLIDENVMGALARHPAIEDLHLEKWIDGPLTFAVAGTPQPFKHLLKSTLRASSTAANVILPHLDLLQKLDLLVIGTKSVFPSISKLTSLKSLWLKIPSNTIRNNDITHLTPLKGLQFVRLRGGHMSDPLDATLVSRGLLASVLGSLPALCILKLDVVHNWGDPFLLALGHACRSLIILSLGGYFSLEPLTVERAVLFPELRSLELGLLRATNPLHMHEWGNIKQRWVKQVAEEVAVHAPGLKGFYCHRGIPDQLTEMVHKAWKKVNHTKVVRPWVMDCR